MGRELEGFTFRSQQPSGNWWKDSHDENSGENSCVKKLRLISRVYLFWEIFLSWKIFLSTIWLPHGRLWVIIGVITPLTRYYSLCFIYMFHHCFHFVDLKVTGAWWKIWVSSQADCLVGFKPRTFGYIWSALTNMERFSRLFYYVLKCTRSTMATFYASMVQLVYLIIIYIQYIYIYIYIYI